MIFLLIYILSFIFANGASDYDPAVRTLHLCISKPQQLDLQCAMDAAMEMSSDQLNAPIFGNRPLLHHVLNLYMISTDPQSKQSILALAQLLLDRGTSPNTRYDNDPDVTTKALIVRELGLAKALADAGALLTLPVQLHTLFSLACNPTPVAKMLLQADTILRKAGPQGDLDAEKLLDGASLHSSAAPPLRSRDLFNFSAHYRDMVAGLGGKRDDRNNMPMIKLVDIMSSVGDLTGGIFKQLIMNYVTASGNLLSTQQQLASMLASIIDKSGRNLLHLLALAGTTSMVQDIQVLFDGASADVLAELAYSLSARDARLLTPIEAAAVRFGHSAHFISFFNLGIQCGSLSRDSSISSFRRFFKYQELKSNHIGSFEGTDGDSGGWNNARLGSLLAGDGRCDITEVHEAPSDPKEFFKKFIIPGIPVIFRAASSQQPQFMQMIKKFDKAIFLERYGHNLVEAASIPYAGTFGIAGVTVNISEVAEVENTGGIFGSVVDKDGGSAFETKPKTNYVFTTAVSSSLKSEAPLPSFLNGIAEDFELQFYLGSAGTGAPPHFHGHAVNSLAYGEKVCVTIYCVSLIVFVKLIEFFITEMVFVRPKRLFLLNDTSNRVCKNSSR